MAENTSPARQPAFFFASKWNQLFVQFICALDTEGRRILLFEAIYNNLHLSKVMRIFIVFCSNMLQVRM